MSRGAWVALVVIVICGIATSLVTCGRDDASQGPTPAALDPPPRGDAGPADRGAAFAAARRTELERQVLNGDRQVGRLVMQRTSEIRAANFSEPTIEREVSKLTSAKDRAAADLAAAPTTLSDEQRTQLRAKLERLSRELAAATAFQSRMTALDADLDRARSDRFVAGLELALLRDGLPPEARLLDALDKFGALDATDTVLVLAALKRIVLAGGADVYPEATRRLAPK